MKLIISPQGMRDIEREAIEGGTDSKLLMQRAGRAIYDAHTWSGSTLIVCGCGNNAGDGYVLAMMLKNAGYDLRLLLLWERFSEDGRYFFDKCMESGIEYSIYDENTDLKSYSTIVDCIFGTGLNTEVTGIAASAIKSINESGAYVISADINSGLNAQNGMASLCVLSDMTVAISQYKPGHFLNMAKDTMKNKCVGDIGLIPRCEYMLAEACDIKPLFKKRSNFSHKGDYGRIAVIGGSYEYSGAVKLANMSAAALRMGAGLCTLAVPASIADAVLPYILESTLARMDDKDGHMVLNKAQIDDLLKNVQAVAVGMGWGRNEGLGDILRYILESFSMPVVIDADGLNTLALMKEEGSSLLKNTKCSVILTPHIKEFSRLSGTDINEIQKNVLDIAIKYAGENKVCLLLKGPSTIVTDGSEIYLIDRGCPGMAKGGSGDVLSGILAGLLGYMQPCVQTIACGAYINGLAGEYASAEQGELCALASDTVKNIPKAIKHILEKDV